MSGARHFSEAEDAVVIRELLVGTSYAAIGRMIDRDDKAVTRRAIVLRRLGRLDRIARVNPPAEPGINWKPPIVLDNDDKLVARCLAEGGFPRAVKLSCGWVLGAPDGTFWKHRPSRVGKLFRAAA